MTAGSYPATVGGVDGDRREQEVTDQCYVLDYINSEPGTPTNLGCFDAGTLTLSTGTSSVEIPWDADECYRNFVDEPWVGETVTFDFAGGDDIVPVSFDVTMLEELQVEVVEDGAGGATVTRQNPGVPDQWGLVWLGAGDSPTIVCEPVDETVTFTAADLAAIDAQGSYKGVIVNMGWIVDLESSLW